jgi:hypothetical protein
LRGRVLEFGHRGWLYHESFLFYDRESDSLWVQATGRCIFGRYKGARLDTIPATHTTWGQWRAMHPNTTVLGKPPALVERYRRDAYATYYARQGTRFGLAVFTPSGNKLYPLDRLAARPVVHDQIGDHRVLVVFHAASRTAVAWEPVAAGDLRLELHQQAADDVWLRDPATGQTWSGLSGEGQDGRDRGRRLRRWQTTQFVVSNWPKHYPGSPVYSLPTGP